jgi:serine/threonine protein kinase
LTHAVPEPAPRDTLAADPPGEALERLVAFMARVFEQRHELKRFVAQLNDGAELLTTLPGDVASPANAAYTLIAAVVSRGLLDAEFFALLLRARPRLSAQINDLRQRCLSVDEPTGSLVPGVVLRSGRYKLEELVDHGAVASVWRAADRQMGAQVAIKVLRSDMRDYQLRRWQFIKGANHLATISHPRVARVIEPHFKEMGRDFCVLQYVQGRSLAEEVKSRRLDTLQAVVGTILDIGTGLAAFHPRIFHGDISPKNIIVSENGHATLVDFDLASEIDELPMTRATGVQGTDPYASPEWRSRSGEIDARTDIFSLGMTAVYALFGGANLPSGLNDSRVVAGLGPFIDKNLNCDATIKLVLARACAFELSERYATVQQFCHELRLAARPLLRTKSAVTPPGANVVPTPIAEQPQTIAVSAAMPIAAAPVVLSSGRAQPSAAASSYSPPPAAQPEPTQPSGASTPPTTLHVRVSQLEPEQRESDSHPTSLAPRRSRRLALTAGGIAAVLLGLATAWSLLATGRQPAADGAEPPPNIETKRAVAGEDISAEEVAEARAAIRNLGLKESYTALVRLQRIIDEPDRSSHAVAQARLLQAELLLTRALACQIATSIDREALGGQLRVRAAEDGMRADALITALTEAAESEQFKRVRALQALVQAKPPDTWPSENEDLALILASARLWRGEITIPPDGLIISLQRVADASSMSESLLALALWRSGNIEQARETLADILARVEDHPLATVMLDALPGREPIADGPATPASIPKPPKAGTRPIRPASETLPKPKPLQSLQDLKNELYRRGLAFGEECKKEEYGEELVHAGDESVTLRIYIDAEGKVLSVEVSGTEKGTNIPACMEKKIKGQRLGPFQGVADHVDLNFKL